MALLRIPYIDYSDEGSTFQTDTIDARTDIEIEALRVAIVAITYVGDQEAIEIVETVIGGTNTGKSTNPEGQREKKWLIKYHRASDADFKYTRELPLADLTNLSAAGVEVDLGAGVGLALKTEWELNVADPVDASAVILDEVEFVGRNL